jgi:hypothetical protein
MTWTNLIFDDEFHIVGRGLIVVVDLSKNGYTEESWIRSGPIKTGDNVTYKGEDYRITGIELTKNLLNGFNSVRLGLMIKKI